jgi:hypothetical protein
MMIGDKLIKEGLITQSQLDQALAEQKKDSSCKIGEILVSLGFLDIEKFTEVLQKDMG